MTILGVKYWQVQTARLAFVVVFEVSMYVCVCVLEWGSILGEYVCVCVCWNGVVFEVSMYVCVCVGMG